MQIIEGDFGDPQVVALLLHHGATAHSETARDSAHALDLHQLQTPEIGFWAAWDGDLLVAIGALKTLGGGHGELKSMHTLQSVRRRGVGSAMLAHLIDVARANGLTRLSLETGSWPYFEPARALYRRHGFTDCEPFGDYRSDPNSIFMTLRLDQ